LPRALHAANPFRGLTQEETRLLCILGAGAFVLASTYSSINVALPQVQQEFDISLSALKWVSIIGAIMVASLSLTFGRVGDLLGRRRVYRFGLIVYGVGSLLTAVSFSFEQLMASRVFMATGLAMANPLAGAIIASSVAPERRGQCVGLFASFQAAGQLMGPTLGGFILDLSSWRAIFVTYAAISVSLSAAQWFMLTGVVEQRRKEAFDLLGSVLLLLSYPGLLIALSFGPGSGWTSTITLTSFFISVVGLLAFGIRESRYEKPIFHFRFFASATFCVAIFTGVVAAFVQSPITLFAPIYLQKVLLFDPFSVGLIMMALPISTLIAGPIGGRLADRRDPRVIAALGAFLTFIAVFIYARLGTESAVIYVIVALALIGFGGGFFRPANQVAVYADVTPADYGALTAMLVLVQSLAGTLGTTITVAISESRGSSNDPAAFTEAQGFTFMLLLPLLAASIVVSLMGRSKPKTDEPAVVPVTEPAPVAARER
jgi:EmrB/QacA subfamily drug resistance transporter